MIKNNISSFFNEEVLGKNFLRSKTINYIKTDGCIGHQIKIGNYWEEWMFKYIQDNYIPNTNMIDLGGNIGTTSFLMSEVLSDNCHIFTFEPIYSDILFKNVLDNNLTDKILIYPYGIGDKIETLKIKNVCLIEQINFGAVSITNSLEDKEDSLKIDIFPLDYFNFENVSLIKIDVEHMEIEALKGSINLIKRCRPTIIIETYQLDKLSKTDIFKELLMIGYEIEQIPEGYFDFIMKIKNKK